MPYYKGSWYSQLPAFGWFDPQDRPGSAAYQVGGRSIPDSQQGIALPSRRTLGQWYNVTPPGGNLPFPMQQTDVGPAKWTGRGVDVSAAAAHQMGYTPKSFPTDAAWKIEPRDEPRGLGSPAGMPVQAGDIPDNTDETAIASGPPERQGRKMPSSLMDMFQPQDAAGQPTDFTGALRGNANAMVGLGMGLLQPYRPGESPYTAALQGYQTGSAADSRRGYQQAQLQHQKTQEARQAANDAFTRQQALLDRDLRERQFARSDPSTAPTEFTRAARDLGLTPGTPEHNQFAKQFYSTKSEGNLAAQAEQRATIARNLGLDVNDPKIKSWLASGGTLNEEGKALPAEMASRVALGGKFLDEAPAIRRNIESGMATDTLTGRVKTYFNMGDQGELARKVKSGTDALLRSLTGAGMPDAEARKYVARYEIEPTDNKDTALSKFDQLHDELVRAEQEAFRGRGGIPRDIVERRRAAHEATGRLPTTPTAPGPTTAPGSPAATAGRGGAAPARPANVPEGSYYSPSRNQWKLPDGTIVDAAGKPI